MIYIYIYIYIYYLDSHITYAYLGQKRTPRLANSEDADADVDVDDPAARSLPREDEVVPVDE